MAETPARKYRLPDDLYEHLELTAKRGGRSTPALVQDLIRLYLAGEVTHPLLPRVLPE